MRLDGTNYNTRGNCREQCKTSYWCWCIKENWFLLFAKLQIMFHCRIISLVLLALQWFLTVPFSEAIWSSQKDGCPGWHPGGELITFCANVLANRIAGQAARKMPRITEALNVLYFKQRKNKGVGNKGKRIENKKKLPTRAFVNCYESIFLSVWSCLQRGFFWQEFKLERMAFLAVPRVLSLKSPPTMIQMACWNFQCPRLTSLKTSTQEMKQVPRRIWPC